MSQGTQVTVTPFNPTGSTPTEVAPPDAGSGPRTDLQQQLVHYLSSSEDPPLPLRRVVVSVPAGLSSKELARLRRSLANGSRSQPMNERTSTPPLPATTDSGTLGGAAAAATASSEVRILRSEVNVLRDEIQQLHAERSELPPSYASGAA
ncbi:hypothetical protein EDB85DRAFT_1944586 [Lactarius pseudohatsudake]|nr:hypothetical protein EDB85DRAFT_1944586 [Lactarius pseudohatsudake]